MARNGSVRVRTVRVSRSGDGEPPEASPDRISALPDSLLHLILVLMPLVDAVRTCVLSRRWRAVWTRLPLLRFDDVLVPHVSRSRFPDLVDGVLRGYADDVDMEDLFVSVNRRDSVGDVPVRFVSTLADLAAQRISGRFVFYLSPAAVNMYTENYDGEEEPVALRLPCFPRVKELSFSFVGVAFSMPTTDTFAKLTKLIISSVRFTDGGEEISQVVSRCCPCIEALELYRTDGLRMLNIIAESLVSLVLRRIMVLEQLVVSAENLRHMLVEKCFVLRNTRTSMFLGVPALEQLLWQDRCPEVIRHRMLPTRSLQRLVVAELEFNFLLAVGGRSDFSRILQLFKCVDILRLQFPNAQDRTDQDNLIENVNLPCYSELEFRMNYTRHKFGPTILNLLKKCSSVKKVTLEMFGREILYMPCPSNCNCRQLSVWTDNAINLDSLECVAMHEFRATQDERSFIYYIMRNAKHLRTVSILLSLGVNPTRRFFRKLSKLSASSGCTVKCYSLKVKPIYV